MSAALYFYSLGQSDKARGALWTTTFLRLRKSGHRTLSNWYRQGYNGWAGPTRKKRVSIKLP